MIDWKDVHVVVTGGAGFIGSHVVDELVWRGAAVTVLDDLRRGCEENLNWARANGRVRLVQRNLAEYTPFWPRDAIVFHLAARVTNIAANRRDHLGMLQENLIVNWRIADALARYGAQLAVLCSTVCVYPHDAPVPTPESAAWPLHPEETNEGYGLAKGILEKQAEFLHRERGLAVVVSRFSNAIGLRDYYDPESSHVVPAFIRRILAGEDPLRVWGSGEQTRAFVDARDLARALVDLAECPAAADARPVNIGHRQEISIAKLARMVAEQCGKPDISVIYDTSYPDGHARRAVDNSRLLELIDWVPDRPLRATIGDMVAEYRGQG